MFYKKGIDITNDKQMFNFLKNHSTYYTTRVCDSIANNVKLYNLNLTGDWCTAYNILESDGYTIIYDLINLWEAVNPCYQVSFFGRSGGYLVLTPRHSICSVLPDAVNYCEDYEEYKRYCKEYYGSVKANHEELRFFTQLVQSFDKLCDELRDYVDELSIMSFVKYDMEKAVEAFNECYAEDLEQLGLPNVLYEDGVAYNLEDICTLKCFREAFSRIADRTAFGYKTVFVDNKIAKLVKI